MKHWFLSIIVGLALVLGLAGPVLANGVSVVQGNITAIDQANNQVTITPTQGAGVVLTVTDTTEIEVPGKSNATLADLKVGDRAKAKYDDATKEALDIEVKGSQDPDEAKVLGTVTAIDGDKVTIHPPQGADVTVTVTGDAEIEVWGVNPAGIGDLKVGDRVKADYNPATLAALEIKALGKGEASLAVRRAFFGTVKAIAASSLTLTTKQGEITLVLNGDTQYWNPPRKVATWEDVKLRDRVAALAVKEGDTLMARRVLVIPPRPVHTQVNGVVKAIQDNNVTIEITNGGSGEITVQLPPVMVRGLEVGDEITLTLLQTPGVNKYLARGLMRGEELGERLSRLREKIKERRAQTEEERARNEKDLEKLQALLQQHMERQQANLQRVIEKAPPAAREALERALENSRRGWEQARESVETEKGKPEPTATPEGERESPSPHPGASPRPVMPG